MAESHRICSIPGCNKPHSARGWCVRHYTRWRNHGDPLLGGADRGDRWKTVALLTELISGQMKSDDCIYWPFSRLSNGYAQAVLTGHATNLAHRIICTEVHGAPPTPDHQVAHSCGRGHLGCVNPDHLRWATSIENHQDRKIHGTWRSGESHGSAKLTEPEVREILSLKGEVGQRRLARRYGVSKSLIGAIHRKEIWGWL